MKFSIIQLTLLFTYCYCDETSGEWLSEFTCGKMYYRTYYVDENTKTLYVGGMDRLYRLHLDNIANFDCESDSVLIEPSNTGSCIARGKLEEYDCRNHIRVIQPLKQGALIYVCGTNAHNPTDWFLEVKNWTITGIPGSAIGKCPFDPEDNATAILIDGVKTALYSATVAEFTKGDSLILKSELASNSYKRTLKYDSKWLDRPNFVGSFDVGDYALFFFRENAVEHMNCGKSVFSRVARVCKNDNGGKHILSQNWVTYLKARLNCSIPGVYPTYYDHIQSVYRLGNKFYATFTSPMRGSAICAFDWDSVEKAFNGRFKEQATSSSAWLPVLSKKVPEPRPGTCVEDTATLPDTVINFIRSHPLMEEAVTHEYNKPVYYDHNADFVKNAADIVRKAVRGQLREYTVHYAGTRDGQLYKIAQWEDTNKNQSHSILLDILDVDVGHAIRFVEIRHATKMLYVGTDVSVKQIDLGRSCEKRYAICSFCVRDPYCGWDVESHSCRAYSGGLLQDVSNESHSICDSSVRRSKINVTFGKTYTFQCLDATPAILNYEEPVWFHYHKEKGRYAIHESKSYHKYAVTRRGALVVVNANEGDVGIYECVVRGVTACVIHVKMRDQCQKPSESEYADVYKSWCLEFQKYQHAMRVMEKRRKISGNKCPGNMTSVESV